MKVIWLTFFKSFFLRFRWYKNMYKTPDFLFCWLKNNQRKRTLIYKKKKKNISDDFIDFSALFKRNWLDKSLGVIFYVYYILYIHSLRFNVKMTDQFVRYVFPLIGIWSWKWAKILLHQPFIAKLVVLGEILLLLFWIWYNGVGAWFSRGKKMTR